MKSLVVCCFETVNKLKGSIFTLSFGKKYNFLYNWTAEIFSNIQAHVEQE